MIFLRWTTPLRLRVLTPRVSGAHHFREDTADESNKTKSKSEKKTEAVQQEQETSKAAADASEEPAITRLNRLLASMPTETPYSLSNKSANATIAQPGSAHKKRKEASKDELKKKDIFVAAKRVADLATGGEQKQLVESELLAKLLGHNQEGSVKSTSTDDTQTKPTNDLSLSELIVGMKIDRTQHPKEQTRGEFVRRSIASKSKQQQEYQQYQRQPREASKERKREAATYTGSVNLYGSEPLGIFKNPGELRDMPDMLTTWAHLQENELKLLVTHPPANYFEKIALWTEQGKVWHFPIDNEQDLSIEVDVDFSEHIFLEQHLEGWCPERGPIRHYMELVCVGLSKNPYVTAKEKKEHILWYRDYFESKKDILKDLISQETQNKAGTAEVKKKVTA
ncbi:small ribosomal subunit protein mS31 [Eurosta solidaginis]|uniref:small ribosomal subunit protein mS31 n=1 Tax=Eurosta solidaginis TaxID=178769 RepID=UPI0035313601